tara:strand:+ start:3076 stop:3258 length:183 start_codon:yes stop_codon:yes gene_type:complete
VAKLVIHAYTKDKNNPRLLTFQEVIKTVSDSLGGCVAWIDVVDETNETTFKHEDRLEDKK